jgi:signal transduction histidine kinase
VEKREIRVDVAVSFTPPERDSCMPPLNDKMPLNPASPIYLYLSVKDSGPGLKPEDLHLLFKRPVPSKLCRILVLTKYI